MEILFQLLICLTIIPFYFTPFIAKELKDYLGTVNETLKVKMEPLIKCTVNIPNLVMMLLEAVYAV